MIDTLSHDIDNKRTEIELMTEAVKIVDIYKKVCIKFNRMVDLYVIAVQDEIKNNPNNAAVWNYQYNNALIVQKAVKELYNYSMSITPQNFNDTCKDAMMKLRKFCDIMIKYIFEPSKVNNIELSRPTATIEEHKDVMGLIIRLFAESYMYILTFDRCKKSLFTRIKELFWRKKKIAAPIMTEDVDLTDIVYYDDSIILEEGFWNYVFGVKEVPPDGIVHTALKTMWNSGQQFFNHVVNLFHPVKADDSIRALANNLGNAKAAFEDVMANPSAESFYNFLQDPSVLTCFGGVIAGFALVKLIKAVFRKFYDMTIGVYKEYEADKSYIDLESERIRRERKDAARKQRLDSIIRARTGTFNV